MASLSSNANLFSRAHKIDFSTALATLTALEGEEDVRAEMEKIRREYEEGKSGGARGGEKSVVVAYPKMHFKAVPPMPSKLSSVEYVKFLAKIPGMQPALKIPNFATGEPFSVPPTYIIRGYDSYCVSRVGYVLQEWANRWRDNPKDCIEKFSTVAGITKGDQFISIKMFVDAMNKYVVASGTEPGLLKRLREGLSCVNRDKKLPVWHVEEMMAGMTFKGERTLLHSKVTSLTYSPNGKANYGLPYPDSTKEERKRELLVKAVDWLIAFRDTEVAKKKMTDSPWDCGFIIKNKFELMEVAKLESKVRPYFVPPAHLSLLFSQIFDLVHSGTQTFLEDPKSMTMCGFSWAHGGARKLVEHLFGVKPGTCTMFNFSDDIHICFRTTDGRLYLFCPDSSFHDMSMRASDAPPLYLMLSAFLRGRLDSTWQNVLRAGVFMALQGPVLFDHSVVFWVKRGMRSGIPGTSRLGSMFAENGMYHTKHLFEGLATFGEAVETNVLKEFRRLMLECGMHVKDTSMVIREIIPSTNPEAWSTLPLPILGQHVRYSYVDRKVIAAYPVPDFLKILASWSRPGNPPREYTAKFQYFLARSMGLAVSGGWAHPQVFDVLRASFDDCLKLLLEKASSSAPPERSYQGLDDLDSGSQLGITDDQRSVIIAEALTSVEVSGLGLLTPVDGEEQVINLHELFRKGFPTVQRFRSIYTDETVQVVVESDKDELPLQSFEEVFHDRVLTASNYDFELGDFEEHEQIGIFPPGRTVHTMSAVIPPPHAEPQIVPAEVDLKTVVSSTFPPRTVTPFYTPGVTPRTPENKEKDQQRAAERATRENERQALLRRLAELARQEGGGSRGGRGGGRRRRVERGLEREQDLLSSEYDPHTDEGADEVYPLDPMDEKDYGYDDDEEEAHYREPY